MPILDHWRFAAAGAGHRGTMLEEEIVLVGHPPSAAAMLIAVPDADGRSQTVTLHDPSHDVVLVTCGTLSTLAVMLDGRRSAVGPHSSDRVTFVPAGTRMVLEHRRDCSMLTALILSAGRLAASQAGRAPLPPPFALYEDRALARRAHELGRLVMRGGEADDAAIAALTADLAAGLAAYRAPADPAGGARIAMPPHKLQRVLAFIDARLDRPITLRELADHASLSPFHFARVFKAATGRAPLEHVRWRRIVHSTALVARTEMKIGEIADRAGFASPAHFCEAFHRAAGIPPSRFRAVVQPRLLSAERIGGAAAC